MRMLTLLAATGGAMAGVVDNVPNPGGVRRMANFYEPLELRNNYRSLAVEGIETGGSKGNPVPSPGVPGLRGEPLGMRNGRTPEGPVKILVATAVIGAVVLGLPQHLAAHHSFAAQYDATKPVETKGVVTQVDWTNPHARFYIEAKDERGQTRKWNFELASPNVLVRNGWKRNTLKIGEQVAVTGYLARLTPPDGAQMAIAASVTASDGRQLFASAQQDLAR